MGLFQYAWYTCHSILSFFLFPFILFIRFYIHPFRVHTTFGIYFRIHIINKLSCVCERETYSYCLSIGKHLKTWTFTYWTISTNITSVPLTINGLFSTNPYTDDLLTATHRCMCVKNIPMICVCECANVKIRWEKMSCSQNLQLKLKLNVLYLPI